MSNSLTASKKVMKTYLSELLTEPDVAEELSHQRVAKRLARKPLALKVNDDNQSLEKLLKKVSEPKEARVETVEYIDVPKVDIAPITTDKSRAKSMSKTPKSYRQGDFQAMFFDVAGLTIAVPLIELGGIHKVEKINSLMGKPDWFKGVMLYRDEKINVVDTALWIMPEKCDEILKDSLNYQYIIMLNDSPWGLMAENLIDTVVLRQDEVKWVDSQNKRPWLAGLVKEKMCALLDVSALIQLLDKGSDIYQAQ
ncbi:MAG: chemotaxis protein CheW [Colwellia sp.]|nr:chemotaxis protein CheW [Colwellia sp.]